MPFGFNEPQCELGTKVHWDAGRHFFYMELKPLLVAPVL